MRGLTIIKGINGGHQHITRSERVICDRMESTSVRRAARYVEDSVTVEGRIQLPNSDDVEEMLETLMKIAKSEGREFLVYLPGMALMEARNQPSRPTYLSH